MAINAANSTNILVEDLTIAGSYFRGVQGSASGSVTVRNCDISGATSAATAPKPQTVQQFQAELILAWRNIILQSQERNANAKQKFATLFVKGE